MTLDETFAILEAAAIAGERCPQSQPHGPLVQLAVQRLARDGRIRSEIYAHNWRVVTLLTGPHAGKKTAPEPSGLKRQPYKVTDKSGTRINGREQNYRLPLRSGPSAPRVLRVMRVEKDGEQ